MIEHSKDTPFIQALGRVPSGLFIITTAADGKRAGYLASFVQQASLSPVIFSIACHPDRYPYQLMQKSGKFAVNVLLENDKQLMKTFAKGHGENEDPFASLPLQEIDGIPLLKDALGGAVFNIIEEIKPGDHVIFFGAPVNGALFDANARPWVHLRKSAISY